MEAYLDNSATTPVCIEAADAVRDALLSNWGNPSSLYRRGIEASELVESARAAVAKKLSCHSEEIYFTSGGTESNNIAILGTANANRRTGSRVVISSVEHSSVEESASQLESEGFEVVRLPVGADGRVSRESIFNAVTADTVIVSIMAVNNETGTIQPVEEMRRAVLAARSHAVIHCDAVQAFGKLELKPAAMGVDLMSISSHKIHGPKGAGALYVRGGFKKDKATVRIRPRTFGGLQEKMLRPGTEPVPAIAGFGAAVAALPDCAKEIGRMNALRSYLVYSLLAIDGVEINSPSDALPVITNISVVGVNSEPMMNFLSARGIYVSSGSACAKGEKSRILKNMGLSDKRISSALRISLSRYTTVSEIDMLVEGIRDGKSSIRTAKR